MTGFVTWLNAQTGRPDAIGDIARAVAIDRDHCLTARTPEAIREHIEAEHDPDPAALDALDRAATEWRAQ